MTRDEMARQRRVRLVAAWKWAVWVGSVTVIGWRLSGPGGLMLGWMAGHVLPYRGWVAAEVQYLLWVERRHVRKVLRKMGIAT